MPSRLLTSCTLLTALFVLASCSSTPSGGGDLAHGDTDAEVSGAPDAVTQPDVAPWVPDGAYPTPGLLSSPVPSPECEGNAAIYVAAEGAAGDGTEQSPRTDWQLAMEQAQPGESVVFLPGTYEFAAGVRTGADGTADARVCFVAADPVQRPVFVRNAAYDGHLLAIDHAYVVVDGFVVDGNFVPVSAGDGYQNLVRIGGQAAILRNSEVRNNTRTAVHVDADDVLIENTEVHHHLRGSFDDQQDAHAISGGQIRHLTMRHCDLHHVTGDCFQLNPDLTYDEGDELWDDVRFLDTVMWTGPMGASDAEGSGWNAGESPGENAIDTKTFAHSATYPTAPFRPQVYLRNVVAHGFDANGFISRRAAFNVKHECDWFFDGVVVYDNQFAFRARGDWESPEHGGAQLVIHNLLAFRNGDPNAESAVFRVERDVPMVIHHATFFDNERVFRHADNGDGTGWDDATLDVRNSLFEGALPEGIDDPSNLVVADTDFEDVAGANFRLAPQSAPQDACLPLDGDPEWDIAGNARDAAPDCGAYEVLP